MTSSIPDQQQGLQGDHPNPALGSMSRSQASSSAEVSEVFGILPWIMQDLEIFEECPVDNMLRNILMDCSNQRELFNEHRKTCLFEECLHKVLSICNGDAQAKNKEINAKSCQVRDNLEEYSKIYKEAENALYLPFVKAANIALLFLQELEVRDLRSGNDSICFHVHNRDGHLQYKPNIIVVPERAGHDVHGPSGYNDTTSNFLLEAATDSRTTRSRWRDVRTFVEFKRSKDRMNPPPESYTFQPTPPMEKYLRLPSHESGLPAAPISSSTHIPLRPLEPVQWSDRQHEEAMSIDSNDRSTPRSKCVTIDEDKDHDLIIQAGGYAAEMFFARVGRLHVIGLIVVSDMLYLWRCDREGAIQCSGFNFIQDLPRFLVLLLAMQRFENQDWGLNQYIDPTFESRRSHSTTLRGDDGKEIGITFELSDAEWVAGFGFSGRATNVFSVKSCNLPNEDGLVAKIFWPESKRTSDILKKVNNIAEYNDDVKGHVPEMLWHKKFEDTSTANIRERLGLTPNGSRVLYMIIFRRLRPIHELTGNDFLQTWWATVKCHLALWRNGVYHRDISESNLMYRRDKDKVVGVLNDFDLASTQETTTCTERTGTVPFMALRLLGDVALRGGKKHLYEHDAESFIWVLIWITLQYSNGAPRNPQERPLDGWLRVDATQCWEKRCGFLFSSKMCDLSAGEGHQRNWQLAKDCIQALQMKMADVFYEDRSQTWDIDQAFKTLLHDCYSNLSDS